MIKVIATVCGTIIREPMVTTNEKGVSNLEFGIKTMLPSRSNDNLSVEITVAIPNGKPEDIKDYNKGNRIVMKGNLVIKKDGDNITFRLADAEPELAYGVPSEDSISGELNFIGKVKEVSEKTDKRGMPYFIMSASASQKVGKDKWERIWFHFKRFPRKKEGLEDIKPDWLKDGIIVETLGDFEISSFNNRLNFTSRISEICQKESGAEQ